MKKEIIILSLLLSILPQLSMADSDGPTPGWVIDLGLSVNWASYNLGASSPEEYGGYYAWGETKEKEYYNSATYALWSKESGYKSIPDINGDPKYDAARANWGGDWRMPTKYDAIELIEKCKKKSYIYKGVEGFLFTGPNGNSIFLPAAGFHNHYGTVEHGGIGTVGTYRTSTQYLANKTDQCVIDFYFTPHYNDGKVHLDYGDGGYVGRSVRPVIKKGGNTETTPTDDAITLTADSYYRVYGEPNPIFDYKSSGAKIGEPVIKCAATATSPVGTYPIVIEQGSVINSNVKLVNGTLTIVEAPLTISAGNYTKIEGEDNPEFKPTYSGFKNNETESVLNKKPTITCWATKDSKPGEYEVVASGAIAVNYAITYQTGTLTVKSKNASSKVGDLSGDGEVNGSDFVLLVKQILEGTADVKTADLNGDGVVNGTDLVMLVNIILGKQ